MPNDHRYLEAKRDDLLAVIACSFDDFNASRAAQRFTRLNTVMNMEGH